MNIRLKVFLSIVLLINLLLIIKKLKLNKIHIRYAVLWIVLSIIFEISVLYPKIYYLLSKFFGLKKTVNMVFLLTFFLLFYLILLLITNISELNEKTKKLVQEVSILKERADRNERN